MIYFNCGTHHASNTAFFNCSNEAGEQIGTFLIDFNTDEKFVYADTPEQSEIHDISPCGTKVLTIDRIYEKRKRKTKIFDLKTKELRFETDAFFGYEAWFTPLEHLLIVRGDVKGKTGDKLFVFDTQSNEIVHFMQGNNPLSYGSKTMDNAIFAYPNSRKKDEVILLDLNTSEEKIVHLGSKKLIHRVQALGNDEFFAIDGDYFGIKFNAKGEILWKTQKIDYDEFYYAPEFFIHNEQIVFKDATGERIALKTGEFTHAITARKGEATPSFADWVIYNTGEMYHLDTNAMKKLDIEKYLKM